MRESQGVAAFLLRDLLEFASFCSLLPMFLPFVLMFLVLFFFPPSDSEGKRSQLLVGVLGFTPFSSPTGSAMGRSRGSTPAIASTRGANPNESEDEVDGKVMVTRQLLASFQHFLRHHRIFTISTLQDFVHQQYHSRQDGRTCCFFLPCVFTG